MRSVVLLVCLCVPAAVAAQIAGAPTLLTDVTLIDGTGSPAQPHRDILIVGNRIRAIGAAGSLRVPGGTDTLRTAGRFVIPGLIDSHVHLATFERPPEMQDALLRNALLGGVTTVRDMGGAISELQEIASRANARGAVAPRFLFSAVMSGPRSMWFTNDRSSFFASGRPVGSSPGVRQVDSSTDIRSVVRAARATGAIGLKLYANLRPGEIHALAREARRQGLRVWAHLAMWPGRPSDVIAGGMHSVSHANMFIRQVLAEPGDTPSEADRISADSAYRSTSAADPRIAALLAELRRQNTALDATLGVMYGAAMDTLTVRSDSLRAVRRTRGLAVLQFSAALTRAAAQAGVAIVAGTDNIGRQSPTIHLELQMLVERAGLSPLAAIHAASEAGARVLGIADSVGTVRPGKVADLVVLAADPTVDIANTQTVEAVMHNGVLHRRSTPMPSPQHARPAPVP